MKHILTIALAIAASSVLHAQDAKPAAPAAPEFKKLLDKVELKDGDSFVFLGDSITHQCLYTQYVEDYFYTRFPKTRIHFHNAGVGGDRASDALRRFEDDVAAFKPKYVTILLGMNDGAYRGFDQPTFDTYSAGMTTILDKIAAIGATAIPMTPTMFDSRPKRAKGDNGEPRNSLYNGVLAFYGSWLQDQASQRGLGFVDMWAPLNDLTIEQRKTDANWTMIADGIHPGPVGQTVMAVAVINDIAPKSPVSAITVAEKDGKLAATAINGTVSDFAQQGDGVSFTFLGNALPWVLPPDTAAAEALTHRGHKLGNEKITVRNLKAGKYELRIDGQPVGQWTDGQLAFGVELEANEKTPQYQQALKVAMLNKERNDRVYQQIRGNYGQLKGKGNDFRKAEAANGPDLAEKKAAFEKWHEEMKTKVTALLEEAKKLEDQIYQTNQPAPHKYELVKI